MANVVVTARVPLRSPRRPALLFLALGKLLLVFSAMSDVYTIACGPGHLAVLLVPPLLQLPTVMPYAENNTEAFATHPNVHFMGYLLAITGGPRLFTGSNKVRRSRRHERT